MKFTHNKINTLGQKKASLLRRSNFIASDFQRYISKT